MPENINPLPEGNAQGPDVIDASAHRVIGKIKPIKIPAAEQKALPGADEDPELMVESPRRIIRQGMWVLFIFFGIFGVWSFIGHISGAVVASGQIKIENERKIVQHLEGGIVDEILVKEGEEVKAGQPLVTLQSVRVDADTNALTKQALDLMARRVRLAAEKEQLSKITWPEETRRVAEALNGLDVLANEEKIFAARKKTLSTSIELFHSQLAQLDEQVKGLQSQIKAENRIISALQNELASKKRLLAGRYLDKSQILELERNLAAHEGTKSRVLQQVAEAKQRAGELNLRIADVEGKFLEDTINTLSETEKELIQTRERIRPMADAKKRLQIVAPVSGKVVDLKIHSRGGVIQPGQTLMDIVPHDQPMLVVTKVPVDKITQVYIDQKAQVQLDAFDTKIQPRMPGKVTYVSADSLEQNGQTFYSCYVEVDPDALKEADMYISPGMPATVYIMTTEKTIIYYIFEPLIKNWNLALRD